MNISFYQTSLKIMVAKLYCSLLFVGNKIIVEDLYSSRLPYSLLVINFAKNLIYLYNCFT